LILNGFLSCHFSVHSSGGLGLSGFAADPWEAVNKVIHRYSGRLAKSFGFNDLRRIFAKRLSIGG
jgi:hypothetical protein